MERHGSCQIGGICSDVPFGEAVHYFGPRMAKCVVVPAKTTANCGATAYRNCNERGVRLPWCPIFSRLACGFSASSSSSVCLCESPTSTGALKVGLQVATKRRPPMSTPASGLRVRLAGAAGCDSEHCGVRATARCGCLRSQAESLPKEARADPVRLTPCDARYPARSSAPGLP